MKPGRPRSRAPSEAEKRKALRALGGDCTAPWAALAFARAPDQSPSAHKVRQWIAAAWPRLLREAWLPLYLAADGVLDESTARPELADPRLQVLALLLEEALYWGVEADLRPDRADRVAELMAELAQVDEAIRSGAAQLARLLQRRREIESGRAVAASWLLPNGQEAPLPFGAMWSTSPLTIREVRRGHFVARRAADTGGGDAPGGNVASMLRMIAASSPQPPGPVFNTDAAAVAELVRGRRPDPWTRLRTQFLAGLIGRWDCSGPAWPAARAVLLAADLAGHPQPCKPLSLLLTAAAGRSDAAPTPALSPSALRKAIYRVDPEGMPANAFMSRLRWETRSMS